MVGSSRSARCCRLPRRCITSGAPPTAARNACAATPSSVVTFVGRGTRIGPCMPSQRWGRNGHYIASDALQRTRTARTIRIRAGKVSTTVGPFVETKEQLGGFFVIEAKDMDEACAVAARFPPARVGVIEIRPVEELKHRSLTRIALVHLDEHRVVDVGAEGALDRFKVNLVTVRGELHAGGEP